MIRALAKVAHCLMVHNYCCDFNMDTFSIRYGFMSQLPETAQQCTKNEFRTQYQADRFAYKIYNEHEVAMMFSEFLVAYATI